MRTGLVFIIAAVLLASTWFHHADVGDAQLYRVVARNLVFDGGWLPLRYLPGIHTPFYEHLPLGFWVFAAVIRVAGEAALNVVCAAFSLGTVALTFWIARRRGGETAGLLAALVLATTPTFFASGGWPMLDPLLVLLTTGSVVPLLAPERPGWRGWLIATVLVALAVGVKGPFGGVPFAAAVLARAATDRRPSVLLIGVGCGLLAALPTAAFLWTHADWWTGYVDHQLLASFTGARQDGKRNVLYPFYTLASRFWPGFALLLFAGVRMVRRRRGDWQLGISAALTVVLLCFTGRKLWNHALIAYPLLAAWIGVELAPLIERWRPRFVRFEAALLVLAAIFTASGGGRLFVSRRCVPSQYFDAQLRQLPSGTRIAVVEESHDWNLLSSLAAEYRAVPVARPTLDQAEEQIALVRPPAPPPPGWSEAARGGAWTLLRR